MENTWASYCECGCGMRKQNPQPQERGLKYDATAAVFVLRANIRHCEKSTGRFGAASDYDAPLLGQLVPIRRGFLAHRWQKTLVTVEDHRSPLPLHITAPTVVACRFRDISLFQQQIHSPRIFGHRKSVSRFNRRSVSGFHPDFFSS
ncbi:hypothetical protein Cob_v006126 [Colletotrichum orbiculare MAFF 240422]|uniref:Uncharacterized protein n=1 Tax=Colletotrichum orbiculare (strain 104-T / ATCC 96160 / CBS 514.97 / LARS 414 / MAFF 240422) TaxID=1213857 RepID=A0A484FTG6_COLOR|nr:hypothetical protein Cob_v006126 [Colletotrichum orbiculare MAFF 240422]